jgi:hypothetical protein
LYFPNAMRLIEWTVIRFQTNRFDPSRPIFWSLMMNDDE